MPTTAAAAMSSPPKTEMVLAALKQASGVRWEAEPSVYGSGADAIELTMIRPAPDDYPAPRTGFWVAVLDDPKDGDAYLYWDPQSRGGFIEDQGMVWQTLFNEGGDGSGDTDGVKKISDHVYLHYSTYWEPNVLRELPPEWDSIEGALKDVTGPTS